MKRILALLAALSLCLSLAAVVPPVTPPAGLPDDGVVATAPEDPENSENPDAPSQLMQEWPDYAEEGH